MKCRIAGAAGFFGKNKGGVRFLEKRARSVPGGGSATAAGIVTEADRGDRAARFYQAMGFSSGEALELMNSGNPIACPSASKKKSGSSPPGSFKTGG